ncbi:MAG: AgmX/PglI C-terminal domain-containing protein [Myxococcota bacterium]
MTRSPNAGARAWTWLVAGSMTAAALACAPATPTPTLVDVARSEGLAGLRPFEPVPILFAALPVEQPAESLPRVFLRGLEAMSIADAHALVGPHAGALDACVEGVTSPFDAVMVVDASGRSRAVVVDETNPAEACARQALDAIEAQPGGERALHLTLGGSPYRAGSLSRRAIQDVIRGGIGAVQRCYERELNAHPDLSGRVLLRFLIAPDGAVTDRVVTENTLSAVVGACILDVFGGFRFPEPTDGGYVIVNYPFVFQVQ